MLTLFYPNNKIGSNTFTLKISGSTKAKGTPFTLIIPLPGFTHAAATLFFFLPNVYTFSAFFTLAILDIIYTKCIYLDILFIIILSYFLLFLSNIFIYLTAFLKLSINT